MTQYENGNNHYDARRQEQNILQARAKHFTGKSKSFHRQEQNISQARAIHFKQNLKSH